MLKDGVREAQHGYGTRIAGATMYVYRYRFADSLEIENIVAETSRNERVSGNSRIGLGEMGAGEVRIRISSRDTAHHGP